MAGTANCKDAARGDLSDVALNWMWQQAVAAGVPMNALKAEQQTVSNPVLHDERDVRYGMAGGQDVKSKNADLQGMSWADTEQFIKYGADPGVYSPNVVGTVDMAKYAQWLKANYGITVNH